jgi:flavin reductase (DIM6/NTAB) family NADH-FMN oxidoreductase RutF
MTDQNISPYDQATPMFEQLLRGAFLTTSDGDTVNTMTIAWGGIQVLWGRPFYVVYVRYSRHTYEVLEATDHFTVSIPEANTLKRELAYCGTKSGRDTDKIKDCGLTLIPGREVTTPVIGECVQHYECKIRYRQAMEPNAVPSDVKTRYYPSHNYHMIYYGEIIAHYQTKGE